MKDGFRNSGISFGDTNVSAKPIHSLNTASNKRRDSCRQEGSTRRAQDATGGVEGGKAPEQWRTHRMQDHGRKSRSWKVYASLFCIMQESKSTAGESTEGTAHGRVDGVGRRSPEAVVDDARAAMP